MFLRFMTRHQKLGFCMRRLAVVSKPRHSRSRWQRPHVLAWRIDRSFQHSICVSCITHERNIVVTENLLLCTRLLSGQSDSKTNKIYKYMVFLCFIFKIQSTLALRTPLAISDTPLIRTTAKSPAKVTDV